MNSRPKFIVRIDHLTDDELVFFGWQCVAKDSEFSLYYRVHDGERQVVTNDPPRFFVTDDYNDAVQMSRDRDTIMRGPPDTLN